MAEKTVLITGATNGIGRAAALAIAALHADILFIARDASRADRLAEDLKRAGASGVETLIGDLSSMNEVRRLAADAAARRQRIHLLLNNAGAIFRRRSISVDGFEMTFALNHLSPFLLTNLVLPTLNSSHPARVITVSSDAARIGHIDFANIGVPKAYRAFRAYGQSKLANILFTQELARRTSGSDITANCCHPGLVRTGFNRNNGRLMRLAMSIVGPFARSPERGAETLVYLAASPDVEGVTGKYFFNCRARTPPRGLYEPEVAEELWRVSAEMTGLQTP